MALSLLLLFLPWSGVHFGQHARPWLQTPTKTRALLLRVCYCQGTALLEAGRGPRRRLPLPYIFNWSSGSHGEAGHSPGSLYWFIMWSGKAAQMASSGHWENGAQPWQFWFPKRLDLISPYTTFVREEVPESITMEMSTLIVNHGGDLGNSGFSYCTSSSWVWFGR